jgi:hypothetical protein
VRGRVIDERGTPIKNADVAVIAAKQSGHLYVGHSDVLAAGTANALSVHADLTID